MEKNKTNHFSYEERFDAKDLRAAEDKFADISWNAFLNHLDELGCDSKVGVVDTFDEIDNLIEGQIKEGWKLSNGMAATFEVIETDNEEERFIGSLSVTPNQ